MRNSDVISILNCAFDKRFFFVYKCNIFHFLVGLASQPHDGFAPGFWQWRGSPVLIMWGSPIWGPAFFTSIRELVKGNHSYRTRRKKVDTEQANKYINKWMNIYIYIYTYMK